MIGPVVILPPSQIRFILAQPDEVLNGREVHKDHFETRYTVPNSLALNNPIHEDVARRDLTRHLGSLIMDITGEIGDSFDKYWGFDTNEWKDIPVFDIMMKTVARTYNRVFVGHPICRLGASEDLACSMELTLSRQKRRLFTKCSEIHKRYNLGKHHPKD